MFANHSYTATYDYIGKVSRIPEVLWSYLAEKRLQLGQRNDSGLYQYLAVVIVRTFQTALKTLRMWKIWNDKRSLKCHSIQSKIIQWQVSAPSDPVYAEERAGLAEDSDYLLDLTVADPLTDATKHHEGSGLERWVVLECKPGHNQNQD